MATLVARQVRGMKEPVYYYHRTYRVKVAPGDSGKGPGSGASRVKTEEVYLGTAEQIRARSRELPKPKTVRVKEFGLVAAALTMVRELGIAEAVDRVVPKRQQGLSIGTYVALGVIAKICAPEVSWSTFGDWVKKTMLPEQWDLPPTLLDAQNFWDHWDLILPQMTLEMRGADSPLLDDDTVLKIEEAVWERVRRIYNVPLDCVLYDATNFFTFFGSETPSLLAKRGKNKAGRDQLRQVSLALAATRQWGLPLLSLLFQGNCHEARLFPESLALLVERITRLYQGAQQVILVFDKGQNSKSNLRLLADKHVDAVGSLVPTHHRQLLAIPLQRYTEQSGDLRVWSQERDLYGLRARVVMTYNAKLAERQRRTHERQMQKAREALVEYGRAHRADPTVELREGLVRCRAQQRAGRYWTVEVAPGNRLVLRAHTEARRAQRLTFGKRLLFSTRPTMTVEEILTTYNRDKQQVEEDFRTLKSPDLVRFQPVRHWTDSKIRIYALVCVLALLVIKLLVRKAQQAGVDISQTLLATELSDIREAYILYSPTRVQRALTEMSSVQRLLYDGLGLAALAPSSDSLPLQTETG